MTRTKRWKVNRLPDGNWLFRHPRCPARRHLCFRGVFAGNLCGVRDTLQAAYRAAANRYGYEVYEAWRVREELAPPPGFSPVRVHPVTPKPTPTPFGSWELAPAAERPHYLW